MQAKSEGHSVPSLMSQETFEGNSAEEAGTVLSTGRDREDVCKDSGL